MEKTIAWESGGGFITLTYTGVGNALILVKSDVNESFADRSKTVNLITTAGSPARAVSLLIKQKGKTYPAGTVLNYNYTSTVQEVTLPAGRYKLQCWGAQGGSNYGTGSKGGYSEGVLTLTETTMLHVFVGGQGSANANGGWNGGGGTTGYSKYNTGGINGYSYPSAGGGATDICLVTSSMDYVSKRTNRIQESFLSRFIVAGGGGGGSYRYTEKEVTNEVVSHIGTSTGVGAKWINGINYYTDGIHLSAIPGKKYKIYIRLQTANEVSIQFLNSSSVYITGQIVRSDGYYTYTAPANSANIIATWISTTGYVSSTYLELNEINYTTSTDTSSSYSSQNTQGGGVSGRGTHSGTQTSAGSGGAFGLGATQGTTNYRYAAGGGGGGWYGGGTAYSDSSTSYIDYTGGGSGFVWSQQTKANVPVGYSVPDAMLLESAVTKDGATSFPNTTSGNEIGHSGNGYCKITVIE